MWQRLRPTGSWISGSHHSATRCRLRDSEETWRGLFFCYPIKLNRTDYLQNSVVISSTISLIEDNQTGLLTHARLLTQPCGVTHTNPCQKCGSGSEHTSQFLLRLILRTDLSLTKLMCALWGIKYLINTGFNCSFLIYLLCVCVSVCVPMCVGVCVCISVSVCFVRHKVFDKYWFF